MILLFILVFIIALVCIFLKSRPGVTMVNGAWTTMKVFLAFLAVAALVGCFMPDVTHEPYKTPPETVSLN